MSSLYIPNPGAGGFNLKRRCGQPWAVKVGLGRSTELRALAGSARILFRALLGVVLWLQSSQAQTNTSSPPANRYLFILDTSKAMQRRSEGTLKAFENLLGSGMGGQVHRGDTIGVWTYNEELHAGQFSLQRWSPEAHRIIFRRVLGFVEEQSYKKQAAFNQVWPVLNQVVKDSPFLTVILISSGNQPIQGTPFDDKINQIYASWQEQQQQARMPFVTLLRAKGGTLTDFSVTPVPWAIELPPLPKELQLAAAPPKKAASPPPKPRPPMAAPLIISGRKTAAADAAKLTASVSTNAAEPSSVPASLTNGAVGAQTLLASATTPSPASASNGVAESPAGSLVSNSALTAAPEPTQKAVLGNPEPPNQLTPGGNSAPSAAAGSAVNPKPEPNSVPGQKHSAVPADSTTAPGPGQEPPTQALEAKTQPMASSYAPSAGPTDSERPHAAPAPQLAVSTKSVLGGKILWGAAGVSALVAILLLLLLGLRYRSGRRHISYITRSLERDKP